MRRSSINFATILFSISLTITGCNTSDDSMYQRIDSYLVIEGELNVETNHYDNQGPHDHSKSRRSGFTEVFESASKRSYSAESVTLSHSGVWYLDNALLGTLSNDRKYGSKSVRIRKNGYIKMSFDLDNGVKTVRIRHAKYGNDRASSWRLVASYDKGSSWTYVGNTVTTSSTRLHTVTFNVNESNTVRYGIQKITGGSNRVNIDNIEIITGDTDGGNNGGEASKDSNLTFGNPSNANSSSMNYFLSKPDFTLSYNATKGIANWVSWHLSSAWTGSTPRCNCFKEDRSLPSHFFRATKNDYRGSGFDRGHLCPSADRNGNSESNANTYYMTNIAPQAPNNNRRTWVSFEKYLRSLTLEGNEIHIVSGVVGKGGTGSKGYRTTISDGAITVPDSFWKVALVLPNGANDIGRVTTSTRVIAVKIPNNQKVNSDWKQYRTTVNTIEKLTGYDLFENIPNAIESVLESRIDNTFFN
ncbi:DNA/RNA non-specific endonuclease [Aquimarina longa]|uniref:DNA/RNA non-specific endonuclease n=1 Tax=Aquimarina longa TaxID=1080221 RepID=UPI0007840B5E|nr:DNA/RNA non-specific endonuclease [Aquimarina longa]